MDCFTSFAMTRVLASTRHFVRNDEGFSKYDALRSQFVRNDEGSSKYEALRSQ